MTRPGRLEDPGYIERLLDRVQDRFEVTDNGCWEWVGARFKATGYGMVYVNGRCTTAHRGLWLAFVGPIEPGLELDHLCRNRACVNPDHLEPVTHAENMRRGEYPRVPACPSGHPYSEENTRIISGRGGRPTRICISCRRAAANKYARRKRKAQPPVPRKRKTHCIHGHEFTPENTKVDSGGHHHCRECSRASTRARWANARNVAAGGISIGAVDGETPEQARRDAL